MRLRRRILTAAFFLAAVMGSCLLFPQGNTNETARSVQGTSIRPSTAPFDVIYRFFYAAAANDWETVQEVTSPPFWSYLKDSEFVSKWENIHRADPTVGFGMFLVAHFALDQETGWAWTLGEAQWTGEIGPPANQVQTIFLERQDDNWKVTGMDERSAAEVVAEFYQAIRDGNWYALSRLTDTAYWGRLTASGIIASLQQDRATTPTGVYVVLHITDFTQGEKAAWVKADVLWRPLTLYERETPVLIELLKDTNDWKITRIHGNWDSVK